MKQNNLIQKILTISLIISLIANIFLVFLNINTNKTFVNENLKQSVLDVISASDDSIEILSFHKTQLELETITVNDYSAQLKELSEIHSSLMILIEKEDFKKNILLKEKTLLFLNERKKMIDNIKSAIDLDSSNYFNVATTAEQEANNLLTELNNLIKEM